MKKPSVGIVAIIAILAIFSEFVVPMVMSSAAQSQMRKVTKSDNLTVSLKSFPGLLMLTGLVNNVEIKAKEAYLGDVRSNDIEMQGKHVRVNVERLFRGNGFRIDAAERIDFKGDVTAKALEELINTKVKNVEAESVEVTPENVKVKAKATLLGKDLKIDFEGNILHDGNKLFLRAKNVSVKGVSVRDRIATRIFGDVVLYDFDRLKFPVRLQSVEHQAGKMHLTFTN
ncbi:MAG: DUF2993 domain-containing protein [Selenomonadaceae bacterium]|nr:DUF2993 domain-containing protein [Selenomonadaceae bacterium]